MIAGIKPGIHLDARTEKWLEETDDLGLVVMALSEMVKLDRAEEQACIDLVEA